MEHAELWDWEAAQAYDTPGEGMFAPEVLGPAVRRLAALAQGGAALEFAIGTGRVALPLLEAGVRVSGIEIAPPMLMQLRTKVDSNRLPVVLGDMATARVPGQFTLVYLAFNGISNLLAQADQVECFRNAARHLGPSGRFVIELWVPVLPHPSDPQAVIGQSVPGYMQFDSCDVVTQQVVSHHFRFGEGKEARLFRSPHRWIWPAELDLMGQLAGFDLESRTADWDGAPFTGASRQHISIYRLS